MAKKLLSVWLSLTILLFSSISIYAGDTVRGQFFLKNIYINGTQIFNYELNNPLFLYKGATYVPITGNLSQMLGLQVEMDMESRTLKLWETEPTLQKVSDGKLQSNLRDVTAEIVSDMEVIAYEPMKEEVAVTTKGGVETETAVKDEDSVEAEPQQTADQQEGSEGSEEVTGAETEADVEQDGGEGEITLPDLKATKLNLGELPLLMNGTTIYFPIKILTQHQMFGWSLYYDSYSGVYISTKDGVDAKTYFNEPQSRYIRGLANYIIKCNGSYTVAQAQNLVAIFHHEARIYNVDHTLLMAMAQKESTFNAKAKGGSGSLGMMQILPSTAKAYGISATQLLDPHTNIEFGAKYIKDRLDMFKGDKVKALSAYNQGVTAVNRGRHSTRYANRILTAQNNLKNYLAVNGYGKGY